jgi:hypothetical protein
VSRVLDVFEGFNAHDSSYSTIYKAEQPHTTPSYCIFDWNTASARRTRPIHPKSVSNLKAWLAARFSYHFASFSSEKPFHQDFETQIPQNEVHLRNTHSARRPHHRTKRNFCANNHRRLGRLWTSMGVFRPREMVIHLQLARLRRQDPIDADRSTMANR